MKGETLQGIGALIVMFYVASLLIIVFFAGGGLTSRIMAIWELTKWTSVAMIVTVVGGVIHEVVTG